MGLLNVGKWQWRESCVTPCSAINSKSKQTLTFVCVVEEAPLVKLLGAYSLQTVPVTAHNLISTVKEMFSTSEGAKPKGLLANSIL